MANSTNGGRPPPQPQPQPQTQTQTQSQSQSQSHPDCFKSSPFLRGFGFCLSLLLIPALVIYILQFITLNPTFPVLRVDSLQLSNFSAAAPSWIVGFSIYNPDEKFSISFQNLESSIYYKDNIIAQALILRFHLRPRKSTALVTPFTAHLIVDESVLNDIKGDLARGTINFTVEVLGSADFQRYTSQWSDINFQVVCSDLAVGFSSPPSVGGRSGQLVGGSRQCEQQ